MILILAIVVAVAAYAVIGLLYGRAQYTSRYRAEIARRRADYPSLWRSDPDQERREARSCMDVWDASLFCAFLWPFAIPLVTLKRVLLSWWSAPIEIDEQRAAQLREDAELWDEKRSNGTKAEREMAAELAKMCRDRARELEV